MPDAGASRKRQISRCRIPSHLTTAGRLTEALRQIPGAEAGTSGPRICRVRRKCGLDWATLASGFFTHADLDCGFGRRAVSGSRSRMAVSGDFRKRRGIRFGFMPARDARASVVPGYRNSISSLRNKGFCNLVSCDVEPRCCDQDLHYVTNPSPCLDRAASQRCCERRYYSRSDRRFADRFGNHFAVEWSPTSLDSVRVDARELENRRTGVPTRPSALQMELIEKNFTEQRLMMKF
jgi:hypothetical protein